MPQVKVGTPLMKLIIAAVRSRRPFLLRGSHGLGKSLIVKEAARELGVACTVMDLSIMEPIDLPGFPVINKEANCLEYVLPKRLPREGKGILLLEELTRAPQDMQAPCFELLTSRCLNDYKLPDGWMIGAAINPTDGEYQGNPLDPALLSRFMVIDVIPDTEEWLGWARKNGIHEACIEYIETHPDAIHEPTLCPRTLEYVSDYIKKSNADDETLRLGMMCWAGDKHGLAIYELLRNDGLKPLSAVQVIKNHGMSLEKLHQMVQRKRTDLIDLSVKNVLGYVGDNNLNPSNRKSIDAFINALPAKYRHECERYVTECKQAQTFKLKA